MARRSTLAAILIWAFGAAAAAPAQVVRDTVIVPDATVKTLDGESVSFRSLLAPKLTLVIKWASWCGGCVEEIPALVEFDRKWRPRGVHVVSMFVHDTAYAKARAIVTQYQIPYPVLVAPEDSALNAALPGSSLPDGYILKGDGKVVIRYRPPPELDFIEEEMGYFLNMYRLR